MADDQSEKADEKPSADDIIRFLEEAGAGSAICPMCHKPDAGWTLFSNRRAELLMPRSDGNPSALHTYIVVCKNCHFVRQHAKNPIDKAILSKASDDA